MPHLISALELASLIDSGRAVRLLDVRWRLNAPEGRPAYLAGHLPGAVYVDLELELARRGHPELGRYPLPGIRDLERVARRWGISNSETVVAYDDNDGIAAARAWWMLRRQRLDVRVLDGGVRAWVEAGLPLDRGDVAPARGTATFADLDPGEASIDEAARAPARGHLVDVRAPQQYRGVDARENPAPGHIPGAVNIPAITHLLPGGVLRSPDEITRALAAGGIAGDRPVVLYCATGIASTHSALAFAVAGIETRVYTGSWSQWSLASNRAVAVGRTPAGVLRGL